MKNLKSGTKIRMLHDCRFGHFKKEEILTIKGVECEYRYSVVYNCEELHLLHGNKRIDTQTDKFEFVILDIFGELGD